MTHTSSVQSSKSPTTVSSWTRCATVFPSTPFTKIVFTTQEPGVTRATGCPDLQNVSALNNASTLTGTSTRPEASTSPKDRLPSVSCLSLPLNRTHSPENQHRRRSHCSLLNPPGSKPGGRKKKIRGSLSMCILVSSPCRKM